MKLKIALLSNEKNPGRKMYNTEINAENYKEVSMILTDLDNLSVPINKAIKEFKNKKSDLDILFGM